MSGLPGAERGPGTLGLGIWVSGLGFGFRV